MSANLALFLALVMVLIAGALYYFGFFSSETTHEEPTHEQIVEAWEKEFWGMVNDLRNTLVLGPDPYNNTGRTCTLFGLRYYVVGYDNYREEYHVVRTEDIVVHLSVSLDRFMEEVSSLY